MNTHAVDKNRVLRHLAIITVLLLLLVGPNFGPIPRLLGQNLSLEPQSLLCWSRFGLAFPSSSPSPCG